MARPSSVEISTTVTYSKLLPGKPAGVIDAITMFTQTTDNEYNLNLLQKWAPFYIACNGDFNQLTSYVRGNRVFTVVIGCLVVSLFSPQFLSAMSG